MFNKREEKIGSILSEILKKNPRLVDGMQAQDIENIWRELFGPAISRYTTNIKLDQEALIVSISSASLRQELEYSKESLLEKLNNRLVHRKLKELKIR